jgi:hypothetical protein
MPDHSTPDRQPASHPVVLVLLFVLVTLAYANSLPNQFTFDDEVVIGRNPLIKHGHHLPTLLANDYWAGARDPASAPYVKIGLYRPLVLLSYAANYAAGGLDPIGYHLFNVLLHFAVVWLIYLLALQRDIPANPGCRSGQRRYSTRGG